MEVKKTWHNPKRDLKQAAVRQQSLKTRLSEMHRQYRLKKVAIQKRYKDKDDEWKSTHSLDQKDIQKMMLVLSKAYEYLILREDKQNEVALEEL